MELTYNWEIVQLDSKPQEGDLQDIVTVVHWRRNVTDGTFFADSYGAMGCPSPPETDFTAYADLTQADVEAWLEQGLDVEEIDARLLADIENKKNPPIIVLPLPWQAPTSEVAQ
jgi:hypothetical protein